MADKKKTVTIVLKGKDTASKTFAKGTKKINAGLKKTQQQAKKTTGALSKIKGSLGGIAAGLVGAFGVSRLLGSIKDLVFETSKLNDEFDKMAKGTLLTVEELSELEFIATRGGVSLEQMTKGIRNLRKNMSELADKGTGEAADAFEAMRISAKKMMQLPIREQLRALADELLKVENVTDRAAYAMELFGGRNSEVFLKALAGGSVEVDKLIDRFVELNIVFDKASTDMGAKMEDYLGDAGLVWRAYKREMWDAIGPTAIKLIQQYIKEVQTMRDPNKVGAFGAFFKGQSVDYLVQTVAEKTPSQLYRTNDPGSDKQRGDLHDYFMSIFTRFGIVGNYLEGKFRDFSSLEKSFGRPGEVFGPPEPPKDISLAADETYGASSQKINAQVRAYQYLLTSGEKTTDELSGLWGDYVKLRKQQIAFELTALKDKGIKGDVLDQIEKQKLADLGKEWKSFSETKIKSVKSTTLTIEKQIGIQVKAYQYLLTSETTTETELANMWEGYKAKRIKQIGFELKALKEANVDKTLLSEIERKKLSEINAELLKLTKAYREREDAAKESAREILAIETQLLAEIIQSEETNTQQRLDNYENYQGKRIQQIKDEAELLKGKGVDTGIIDQSVRMQTEQIEQVLDASSEKINVWVDNMNNAIYDSFSGIFRDSLYNDLQTFEDYFRDFCARLADAWFNNFILEAQSKGGGIAALFGMGGGNMLPGSTSGGGQSGWGKIAGIAGNIAGMFNWGGGGNGASSLLGNKGFGSMEGTAFKPQPLRDAVNLRGGTTQIININGVTDFPSFKESTSQLYGQLNSAISLGGRNN